MIHSFPKTAWKSPDVNTGNIFLFDEITAGCWRISPDRPPTLAEARAQLAKAYPEGINESVHGGLY